MTLAEFRSLVQHEFGCDLHAMTPANAREFLDRLHQGALPEAGERIHLTETQKSYEGILRDSLQRALELPPEQGVIVLWLYCLELAAAAVADVEEQRLGRLLPDAES